MKITMYELLGKIKNGEEVPKKIKYNDLIYVAKGNGIEDFVDYCSDEDNWCFNHYVRYENLDDEVEIIEEEIKEIDNSDLMELLETTSKKDFYRLTLDHELVVRLYNWITNLQKENETLKELNICVGCENNPDYKSRCEKAIDKMSKLKPFIPNEIPSWLDELENILNGGDKDENKLKTK